MTSSIHEGNFPPVSILLKNEPQANDRLIINDLITWWKSQFKKDLNIIGRYGYKKCLLIFANDLESFDFLIHKSHWPKKIQKSEYEMKLPKVFPSDFSLVVQYFPKSWDEQEIILEVKEKYPTLVKLTRLYGQNDTTLNSVRADFHSLQQVKSILQEKFIFIDQMKLPVKIYYQPVRIRKCMKCFSHDHATYSCSSQRVCIRCGEQHPLNNICQNEIKCVNCKQNHYAGHPSCPIVQKKRRELAEQQKINRSKLLINTSAAQYEYINNNLTAPSFAGASAATTTTANYLSAVMHQQKHSTQQLSSQDKPIKEKEHIEQLLLAHTSKTEARLSTLGSTLTSQLSELEIKIDNYNDRLSNLEQIIFNTLLPAIESITKIVSAPTCSKNMKQEILSINKTIVKIRKSHEHQTNQLSRSLVNQSERSIISDEYDQ